MKLLLFSNSTMPDEPYLHWTLPYLKPFLAGAGEAVFVPFAGVDIGWDAYTERVAGALPEIRITGLHTVADKAGAISGAGAIIVGGGNTFCLLRHCQDLGILPVLREVVVGGARYTGWSAGANLACPTIKTTNDMPIVAPDGLEALGLIPIQINPHFTDKTVTGHGGESRAQRLHEFTCCNPDMPVLGLPEGMFVEISGDRAELRGTGVARRFLAGRAPESISAGPLRM